ncbi:MAG TPA: hypothetical protein VNY51_10490 [Candidatus Dormibacteraeota bacterium]|nr:hypothetical protein [Candidatus Dormibacteraeota bacterium]
MPSTHPKGLLACLYAGAFMAGAVVACNAIIAGQIIWPLIFLAVWPGLLLAIAVFVIGAITGVEVTFGQIRAAFVYGEVGLVCWIAVAGICSLAVAVWPVTIVALLSFPVWVKAFPTVKPSVASTGPAAANPSPRLFHLSGEEDMNFEHRLHHALEFQDQMAHKG